MYELILIWGFFYNRWYVTHDTQYIVGVGLIGYRVLGIGGAQRNQYPILTTQPYIFVKKNTTPPLTPWWRAHAPQLAKGGALP